MNDLLADLVAEQDALDRAIDGVASDRWDMPSPAEGWLLRDCVAHLAEMDDLAAHVAAHRAFPEGRGERRDPVLSNGQLDARAMAPDALIAWWREARQRLAASLDGVDPKTRLPWAGPPMSARSFATARLMEAWSHGLDILDAAGRTKPDSDRLRHVAHIGYATREFAYRNRGLTPPESTLYVELRSPSGAVWTWGPEDATDRISGEAGEFCRVVTQRIHWRDTALKAEGPSAQEFLTIAQAFAGPPGPGRAPKSAD